MFPHLPLLGSDAIAYARIKCPQNRQGIPQRRRRVRDLDRTPPAGKFAQHKRAFAATPAPAAPMKRPRSASGRRAAVHRRRTETRPTPPERRSHNPDCTGAPAWESQSQSLHRCQYPSSPRRNCRSDTGPSDSPRIGVNGSGDITEERENATPPGLLGATFKVSAL